MNSSISRCYSRRGDLHHPFSWGFILDRICKASTYKLWVLDAKVGLEKKIGVGSSSCHITGLTSNRCKWISGQIVYLLVLLRWRGVPWRVSSLGIRGVNVVAWGRISWGIRLLTFCVVNQNSKGIWNLIRCTRCRLKIQPSVFQINILGFGHIWQELDKILPIWLERAGFHVRHGREIIPEDHLILGTYSASGWVPH